MAVVVKEKTGPDDPPVEDPNTIGAVLALPKEEDPPNAKPVEGDELNAVLKGEDFGACQLPPKMLVVTPLELAGLFSAEEDKGLTPKMPELELTTLAAEELPPKLKTGAAALLELIAFVTETVAVELAPKLKVGALATFELIACVTDEEDGEA